jgi:putative membrane protein insertion efficiency factor
LSDPAATAQNKDLEDRVKTVPLSVRLALFALRFYKAYLSMLFAGSCRFEPTCSRYAYEAIERFGLRRGSWLTLKRLLRCQPLSRKFGYDPVPEMSEDMASKFSDRGEGALEQEHSADAREVNGFGMNHKEAHS